MSEYRLSSKGHTAVNFCAPIVPSRKLSCQSLVVSVCRVKSRDSRLCFPSDIEAIGLPLRSKFCRSLRKMHGFYPGFEVFDVSVAPEILIHGVYGGSGPPLLLIHGFPQTHLIWHKVAPQLTSKYTIIVIDIRGYGASSKPHVDYERKPSDHKLYAKSAMAEDCATLMTKLGHDSFFVCGHDRGGRIAHKMCVNYPGKVRKCMVLDICPTKAMYEKTNMQFAQAYFHWFFLTQPPPFPEKLLMGSPDVMAEKCFGGFEHDESDEEAILEYKKQFSLWDSVHAMCEDYRASMQEDIEESTADIAAGRKIKAPFMVLWGNYGVVEKMFDAKAEWENVCEPGLLDQNSRSLDCGHYIPEEAPDDLVKHIEAFFT